MSVYLIAIALGFIFPSVAFGLFCALALYLVVPFKEMRSLLIHRPPPEA